MMSDLVSSVEVTQHLPKGVYLTSWGNRYWSKVQGQGRVWYLGTFATPEEARAAYLDAKKQLGQAA
jgi:hypothetical protein